MFRKQPSGPALRLPLMSKVKNRLRFNWTATLLPHNIRIPSA